MKKLAPLLFSVLLADISYSGPKPIVDDDVEHIEVVGAPIRFGYSATIGFRPTGGSNGGSSSSRSISERSVKKAEQKKNSESGQEKAWYEGLLDSALNKVVKVFTPEAPPVEIDTEFLREEEFNENGQIKNRTTSTCLSIKINSDRTENTNCGKMQIRQVNPEGTIFEVSIIQYQFFPDGRGGKRLGFQWANALTFKGTPDQILDYMERAADL